MTLLKQSEQQKQTTGANVCSPVTAADILQAELVQCTHLSYMMHVEC